MSTVILLSSSPPPVFAPSPTPVRSSSPAHTITRSSQGHSPSKSRFRVSDIKRDGFSSPFSTARQVLAQKSGAENAMNISVGKNKFRSSQEKASEERDDGELGGRWRKTKSGASISREKAVEQIETQQQENNPNNTKTVAVDKAQSDCDTDKSALSESVLLERAVSRRLDWTPPSKSVPSVAGEEKPVEYSAGLMNGMLSSFKYNEASRSTSPLPREILPNPAKRRRVDGPNESRADITAVPPTRTNATKSNSTKTRTKTTRSSAKKPLTITGLATSNYAGDGDASESSLVHYLISTQAQLNNTSADPALETEVQKTKAAASRLRTQRKKQLKSLLVSPQSAMKSYDAQEAIFGSASQLAQDESPAFLREMIEATKESESFLMSDPFSSPQRTQLRSVDNTPKAGISRYQRTRNLWSAAGRDVDNALLHVDTIDLTDTPAVRAAFAGKDVMVQSDAYSVPSLSKPAIPLNGGFSSMRTITGDRVIDIDDLRTPGAVPTRTFCSSTRSASPRKSPVCVRPNRSDEESPSKPAEIPANGPGPIKPNYEGFTTRDLNKQIKAFGFKAMRKREKMIELLDRCWEEKHGPSKPVNSEPEILPYGNFLSDVHDISARPQPKPKKVTARRKKVSSVAEAGDKPAKKPRQRKKKDANVDTEAQPKPKAPRKRKAKASLDAPETIMDVDQLWDKIPDELRNLETFDDWAKPERKSKPNKTLHASATVADAGNPPPTPPATLPAASTTTVVPPIPPEPTPTASEEQAQGPTPSATPAYPSSTLPPPPPSKIMAAIMQQSRHPDPGRNHRADPTWHEKMLLYDPIVLEDLATWLNTEGLAAVGEDGEVSALEVREWCEGHGVCCLWRGGWRGNKQTSS